MAYKNFILVCAGSGCESEKSKGIYEALVREAEAQGVKGEVQVVKTGCFGFCEKGPIVKVLPQESFYVEVKPEDAKEIIAEQMIKGREVERLLYKKDAKALDTVRIEGAGSYQKQFRVVLRNCGVINPENIDEYIARDGYKGLERALFEMKPERRGERAQGFGASRPRGRGLPDLAQVGPHDQGARRREVRRLQRRRGRPRRLHEPLDHRGRSPFPRRGDGDLRLYDRREAGLHIHPCRVSPRHRASQDRHQTGQGVRALGDEHPRLGRRLRSRHTPRRRRLRLRRGDRPSPVARRQARHADAQAAVPRGAGPVEEAYGHQQRGDVRERRRHHDQGRRVVLQDRDREVQGDQDLRPHRQDRQLGPRRGADGDDAAGDHLQHRRRHQGRQEVQGCPDRRALGRHHHRGEPRRADQPTRASRPSAR